MHENHSQGFTRFLKKSGKKPHVIAELVRQAEMFEAFLAVRGKELEQADRQDALEYISHLEEQEAGSARVRMRGVALYYKYAEQPTLAAVFSEARQTAITSQRKALNLAEFVGVNPQHVARLKALGVRTTEQMLEAGKSPALRQQLAEQSGVPAEAILEMVKLSDLARISGVKAIRARLYYEAGVDTVEKMAACEAEELLRITREFVQRTGFDGIAPLPKEVRSTIETARGLPVLINT